MPARSENWPAQRKPHAPMFSLPVPVLHVLEPSLPGFRITDLPMTKHSMIGHRHVLSPTHMRMCSNTASHLFCIRNRLRSPPGRLQGSPSLRCGQRHTLEEQRLSVLNYPKQLAHVISVAHYPQT
jgi:hypothetical protein